MEDEGQREGRGLLDWFGWGQETPAKLPSLAEEGRRGGQRTRVLQRRTSKISEVGGPRTNRSKYLHVKQAKSCGTIHKKNGQT